MSRPGGKKKPQEGEMPYRFEGLLLELDHLVEPRDGGGTAEEPRQLRVRPHVGLDEHGGLDGRTESKKRQQVCDPTIMVNENMSFLPRAT